MVKIQTKRVGCTKCGLVSDQLKNGLTAAGSQRILCKICKNRYTPIRKGYSDEVKKMAVKSYMSGNSARKVGRQFGMDGNTVTAWVNFFQKQ